jgi:type I restriction enzyme R subunit
VLRAIISPQAHSWGRRRCAQKTGIIIEHFRENIADLLGGRAKAMVVTGSRKEAVRYKLAFDKYLSKNGYTGIAAMVAFSGEGPRPGIQPA